MRASCWAACTPLLALSLIQHTSLTLACLSLHPQQGDTFLVRGGMRTVEFKVVETDPDEYCSASLSVASLFCVQYFL